MAYTILVDEAVRQGGDRRSLTDALDKHEKWAAGYDEEAARIRRNQRQMARFERRTAAAATRTPPVRGRRTGKPAPPGARR